MNVLGRTYYNKPCPEQSRGEGGSVGWKDQFIPRHREGGGPKPPTEPAPLPWVDAPAGTRHNRTLGDKRYEFRIYAEWHRSNHLGNACAEKRGMLVVLSDLKLGQENGTADSTAEYYSSDVIAAEYRIHDPRLGRFLSVDPLTAGYPWYSPYQFAGNKVINSIDIEGLEEIEVIVVVFNDGTEIPIDIYWDYSYLENEGRTFITIHKVNLDGETIGKPYIQFEGSPSERQEQVARYLEENNLLPGLEARASKEYDHVREKVKNAGTHGGEVGELEMAILKGDREALAKLMDVFGNGNAPSGANSHSMEGASNEDESVRPKTPPKREEMSFETVGFKLLSPTEQKRVRAIVEAYKKGVKANIHWERVGGKFVPTLNELRYDTYGVRYQIRIVLLDGNNMEPMVIPNDTTGGR